MVFVNENFAVDDSFEDFLAQNMRIESIYRQRYNRLPRPDSPCVDRFFGSGPPGPDLFEVNSEETETLNSEEFLQMLNNARFMDSSEVVEEYFVFLEDEETHSGEGGFEDDLTLDDFDTAEFDTDAEFELLDPWENQFFEMISLIINCLRFIITL